MAAAGAALASCAKSAVVVEEVPLAEVARWIRSRQYPVRAVTEAYLRRIAEVDSVLKSVIQVNPEALDLAARLDAEASAGQWRGPLHGVPILLKDNIDTADQMLTTAGSLALMDSRPKQDAPLVARLRAAGAVILGKTNLSEWANIRSTRSTSGWSARGGQTRNPYALDRNTSGSSSGSGAAAAASLCAAAVGTETDGSIVSPSSVCGLVGIKPTVGLISGQGIIPISHSQDTAGPMARSVRDAALLLGAMTVEPRDYAAGLREDALRGARIGVVRQLFGGHDRVVRLAERALETLKKQGAEIVDPVEIASIGKFEDAESPVLLHELKAGLAAYLATRTSAVKTLADVIAFNEKNREREMPWFGQELFVQAQAKGGLDSKEYTDALAKCQRLTRAEGIDRVMADHRLDALFAPTDGPAWPIDWTLGDHFTNLCSTLPAVAGYPHITVPGGLIDGLPVGVSFFGRAHSEARLIGLAYAYEQASKLREKPRYRATVSYA